MSPLADQPYPQCISPSRPTRTPVSTLPGLDEGALTSFAKAEVAKASSTVGAHASARTTLDEFIGRLLELRARGAGALPVVIESRSRSGAVIYGEANARRDRLVRVGTGWRSLDAAIGELTEVVRVG